MTELHLTPRDPLVFRDSRTLNATPLGAMRDECRGRILRRWRVSCGPHSDELWGGQPAATIERWATLEMRNPRQFSPLIYTSL